MKFVIFGLAVVLGVPAMAGASMVSRKLKNLLFAGMVASLTLGAKVSINLQSMEFYRGPVRGYEITGADLVCWGLILGMIIKTPGKISWFPRFFLPLLAFFIMAVANVQASKYQIYGWFVIWQFVRAGLLYWCVYNFFGTDDCDYQSMKAVWLGIFFTGSLLFLQTFKQKYLDGIYRAWAFFDHSNTIPSFVLIVLCMMFVWGLYDERLNLIEFLLSMFAAMGLVFATFATGSRTGMLTAAGSVVASLVIAKRKYSSKRLKLAIWVVIFGMIVGGAMVMDTLIDRFLNAPKSSEEARDEFNVAAEKMAEDYAFGVGLNQFSEVLTVTTKYRKDIKVMANEKQAGVAHHIYLLTKAEMGNIGMWSFIAIIGLFELSLIIYGLRWTTLEQRLMLGLAVGSMAFYAIGLYEWVFRQTPVFFQYVIAMGFGQALIAKDKKMRKAGRT